MPSAQGDNIVVSTKSSVFKFGILVSTILVLMILVFIGYQLIINSSKKKESASSQSKISNVNNPYVIKIDNLISEIDNLPESSIRELNSSVWEAHKLGIIAGGGNGTKFPGLKNVKEKLSDGKYEEAKKLMEAGIFSRIANPIPTKNNKSEEYEELSKAQIQKYDPKFIFFSKDAFIGVIAKSRYNQTIKFIQLYYSL